MFPIFEMDAYDFRGEIYLSFVVNDVEVVVIVSVDLDHLRSSVGGVSEGSVVRNGIGNRSTLDGSHEGGRGLSVGPDDGSGLNGLDDGGRGSSDLDDGGGSGLHDGHGCGGLDANNRSWGLKSDDTRGGLNSDHWGGSLDESDILARGDLGTVLDGSLFTSDGR